MWDEHAEDSHNPILMDSAWEKITGELYPTDWGSSTSSPSKRMVEVVKIRWHT